jgi:hypothetical protein
VSSGKTSPIWWIQKDYSFISCNSNSIPNLGSEKLTCNENDCQAFKPSFR